MLLMSTLGWILIVVGVVILVVFIGTKIKDRYYQKAGDFYLIELVVSAAGGRYEVHFVLRVLVTDAVNKNISEPKSA